jgi:hypothetical protein
MSHRRVESFLLRLVVHEQHSTVADQWRGRVQHIGSGSERQFEQLQDMIDFITEQVAGRHSLVISCDERLAAE